MRHVALVILLVLAIPTLTIAQEECDLSGKILSADLPDVIDLESSVVAQVERHLECELPALRSTMALGHSDARIVEGDEPDRPVPGLATAAAAGSASGSLIEYMVLASFGTDYVDVEFTSDPPGAEVWVNNVSYGATVKRLRIRSPLMGSIAFRMPGYAECTMKDAEVTGNALRKAFCGMRPSESP